MDRNDTESANAVGDGINARPLKDTIAGTGPGIPDDALAPGEAMPEMPSEEEQRRIAEKLGAPPPID